MKIKKIITHPFTLVASFSSVFISGQGMDNFYFRYLVIGLAYGAAYAIVGSLGISVILFNHYKRKPAHNNLETSFINLVGAILLIISLCLFYYQVQAYNIPGIFVQMAHLMSLLIFCVLVTCFVIIFPLNQKDTIKTGHN